jgi:hypothetical protein
MAKDDFGLGISSAAIEAIVQAAKQSARLMDGLAAHSALKEQMRLSSAVAFSPGSAQQVTSIFTRIARDAAVRILAGLTRESLLRPIRG